MRLLPFGRRKAAPEQPPETNHDWAVGDLGECINDAWRGPRGSVGHWVPSLGEIVRVSGVGVVMRPSYKPGVWLRLHGGGKCGYCGGHFRKIVIQHEPASAEFTAKLRDRKPVPA